MNPNYEQELEAEIKRKQKDIEQGVAATNFLNTGEGKLIQDWINDRVSYLMDKMTGIKPLDDREYLQYHGAVKELKDFNVMLNTKKRTGKIAQEEMKVLNEQRDAIQQSKSESAA